MNNNNQCPNKKNKLLLTEAAIQRYSIMGLKLHVTHYRRMRSGGLLPLPTIRNLGERCDMLATGGETEVTIIDLHAKSQTVGLAICGKKDHYNRMVGITMVFNLAFASKETSPINPDYLSPDEKAFLEKKL